MRIAWIFLLIGACLIGSVSADPYDFPEVPDSGKPWMPPNSENFGEGLFRLFSSVLSAVRPDLKEAVQIGSGLIAVSVLISLLHFGPEDTSFLADLAGSASISVMIMKSSFSMIRMSADIITELSNYSKLFIPAIAAASASCGAITASASLYIGTTLFVAVLSQVLSQIVLPGVYLFLIAAIANSTAGNSLLKNLKEGLKKGTSWFLKTTLTLFTSYMGITGVISGTSDAAALKATKAAISTAVPVIGKTLADASESILIGAAMARNAMGIYGIYAILAVFLAPFLRIAVHYLILKAASSICSLFDVKGVNSLVEDFSSAMGLLLAITGSLCLLLLISTICFIKEGG